MKIPSFACLATATLAVSTAVDLSKRSSPLDVKLVRHGNTNIRATITNSDNKGYNLLHRGSILDPEPVRKLHVTSRYASAPFHGVVRRDCSHGHSSDEDFTFIPAGQAIYRDLDIAEFYDLDNGIYDVSVRNDLSYAEPDSTVLTGDSLPFTSNTLSLSVNASEAAAVPKAISKLDLKRSTVESDCSASQASAIAAGNSACASLANAAADAAASGSAEMFSTYFQSTSASVRSTVAANFRSVAKECSSTPGGTSTSHCTDRYNMCRGDLLAYTMWKGTAPNQVGTLYYCPRYFSVLSAKSSQCHEQSQATNTLHETTHAVFGTKDVAYGYSAITKLSSSQAVVNADTYALYATDVNLGCGGGGSTGGGSTGGASGSSGASQGTAGISGSGGMGTGSTQSSSGGSSLMGLFNSLKGSWNA